MKLWLESGLVKINKEKIHHVTKYPTLDQVKTLCYWEQNVIEEQTKAKWNNQGMYIDGIKDRVITFVVCDTISLWHCSFSKIFL